MRSRSISPDIHRERRFREGKAQCQVCLQDWPVSMIKMQDGLQMCPNDYQEGGGEIAREQRRARAADYAARMTAKRAEPPKYPGRWDGIAAYPAALNEISPDPIELVAGGAGVAVTLGGVNFTGNETRDYGDAGITESGVTVTSTEISLTLTAAAGVTPGTYKLTFDGTGWPDAIKVFKA